MAITTDGSTRDPAGTPQPLATTDTPQFARLGVGVAADTSIPIKGKISATGVVARFYATSTDGLYVQAQNASPGWGSLSNGAYVNAGGNYVAVNSAGSIIVMSPTNGFRLYTFSGQTPSATITTANYLSMTVSPAGSTVLGNGALATNATDGFLYITTCPGTPTGTPTAATGRSALVWDSTNDKLYAYDGGWQQVGGSTAYYERVHLSGAPRHDGTITWQVVNGSWSFSVSDTGHLIGGAMQNESTKTQNDEIKKRFKVPANGTYAVRVCYVAEDSSGIVTVGVGTDGTTFSSLGTFDAYQGGTDYYNHWSSELSAGSLTAGTEYWLHLKVASKHASSSAYKLGLQFVDIYRTA